MNALFLLSGVLLGCGPSSSGLHAVGAAPPLPSDPGPASAPVPDAGPPTATRAGELPALDGFVVNLRGVYRQQALAERMGGPSKPTGTVAIELEGRPSEASPQLWDGAPMLVRLGGGERPPDEIERLRDQRVEVQGTLVLRPPLRAPPNTAQSLPVPTLENPGPPTLVD